VKVLFQRALLFFESSSKQQVSSNLCFFFVSLRATLWHQHLAHPSDIVLTKLMPNLDIKNIPCDTCHLSKSTRLPFMLSLSKACKMFDIVHFNVWDQLLILLMVTNILFCLLMTSLVLLGFTS